MTSRNSNSQNPQATQQETTPMDLSSPPPTTMPLPTPPSSSSAQTQSPNPQTQKLRQIAPAPPSPTKKSDFDVYHIPRGFEVLLVPKGSSPSATGLSVPPVDQSAQLVTDHPAMKATKPVNIPTRSNTTGGIPSPNSSWRKRKSSGHIPRPKNCFMAYREQIQHQVLEKNPGLNNKVVSVLAAQKWNTEPEEVKQHWREVAKRLKAEHMLKYPNYKFSPKKKVAKNAANGSVVTKPGSKTKKSSDLQELCNGDGFESPFHRPTPTFLHSPAVWGHYRSPSSESTSSWTSESSTSTPPFETPSPRSFSPPQFETPEHFERSPSPLRFEAGSNTPQPHHQRTNSFPSPANSFVQHPELQFFDPSIDLEIPSLNLENFSFDSVGPLLTPTEFENQLQYDGFLENTSQMLNSFELNVLQNEQNQNRNNNWN